MSQASDVPSPCINVCRINQQTGWCEGCFRTVREITQWPIASDAERRRILAALPGRRAPKKWWKPW
jgi:predicted Fe-S protein YdhL (DUF1289 family)